MATITAAKRGVGGNAYIYTWANILAGDTCTAVGGAEFADSSPDRTVQVSGTFAATIDIQGALSDTNPIYAGLTDALGVAISKTAADISAITEMTTLVKPVLTGGDGTTNITVVLLVRGNR